MFEGMPRSEKKILKKTSYWSPINPKNYVRKLSLVINNFIEYQHFSSPLKKKKLNKNIEINNNIYKAEKRSDFCYPDSCFF